MKLANNIKLSTYRLLIKKRGLTVKKIRDQDFSNINFDRASFVDASFVGASFVDASFNRASFNGASFNRASFRYASFLGVIGDSNLIHTLQTDEWVVAIYSNRMQIGCENHTIKRWLSYDDNTISAMDSNALEFCKKWKPLIQQYILNLKNKDKKQ